MTLASRDARVFGWGAINQVVESTNTPPNAVRADQQPPSPRRNSAAEGLVRLLCERFAWDFGEYWEVHLTPGQQAGTFRRVASWHRDGVNSLALDVATEGATGSTNVGVLGRALSDGECIWIEDLRAASSGFVRAPLAVADGFSTAMAMPLLTDDGPLAILLFLSVEPRKSDDAVSDEMVRLAGQVGGVVKESWAGTLDIAEGDRYFRALIESIHDVIIVMAVDGQILYESVAVKQVLGYGVEDWDGQSIFSALHRDDVPKVLESVRVGVASPGETQRLQVRVRHKDGSWRWMESVGSTQMSPAGLVVVVTARDITDTKLAQEALVERESRLELLNSVARALLDERSTEDTIQSVLTEIAPRFPELRVSYAVVDDASLLSFLYSREHPDMPSIAGLSVDFSRLPEVVTSLRNGEALRFENASVDPRMAPISDVIEMAGTRGLLLVPLTHSDRLIGILGLASKDQKEWSQHEETTLAEIGGYLSIALREASQRELRGIAESKLREMSDQLRGLLDAFPELGRKPGVRQRPRDGASAKLGAAEPPRDAGIRLTAQNVKVLRLLAEGKTNNEIAKALFLSPDTVKDHTRAIFTKLRARNRAEAVMLATKRGII